MQIEEVANMKTVIVNREFEKDYKRFLVNTDWSLEELQDYLKIEFSLDPSEQIRLKSHVTNKYFTKEELGAQLNKYPEFNEGGARMQLDLGVAPSLAEFIVKVCLFTNSKTVYDLFVNAEVIVKELKEKTADLLGVKETNLYTLYRANHFDEPQFALRREGLKVTKCNISTGDLLILKENS